MGYKSVMVTIRAPEVFQVVENDLRTSRQEKCGFVEDVPHLLLCNFSIKLKKMMAITSEDPINRRFLDSFLMEPESQFEPITQFTYDVFMSYAEEDKDVASEIRGCLSDRGISCFMAGKDIYGGMIWEENILGALKKAKTAVILLTPNSMKSRWVMCEAGALWALGKPMVPAIMHIEIGEMPEPIKKYQAIRIESTEGRQKLYDEVTQLCGIL